MERLEKSIACADYLEGRGGGRQEIAPAISFWSDEAESLALASASRISGPEQCSRKPRKSPRTGFAKQDRPEGARGEVPPPGARSLLPGRSSFSVYEATGDGALRRSRADPCSRFQRLPAPAISQRFTRTSQLTAERSARSPRCFPACPGRPSSTSS